MKLHAILVCVLLSVACQRSSDPGGPRPLDAGAPPLVPAPHPAKAEAATRRAVEPSLLRVDLGAQGSGTAFACVVPGLACTAKHLVGNAEKVRVVSAKGRALEVPVVGVHPTDDVALLDIRPLALPPLALTLFDLPPVGLTVCRIGHPPSHPKTPFVRCDPVGGSMLEAPLSDNGTVVLRLVHLGLGLKGDSGAPLYDPQTGLVVGMHVSEANGSGRATSPTAIHDAIHMAEATLEWVQQCTQTGGPTEIARRTLLLSCPALSPLQRAEQFRFLGTALLDLGRRAEALAAFDEALEAEPLEAVNWLWRALTFPQSAQARDDAAFAMRLRPALRHDASLDQSFPAGYRPLLRGLRDEVAPQGARLATLVGEGACASCPEFCQAARRKAEVRLWAVEGANHPIAESFFRSRIGAREGAGPFLAIDEHYALGCGKIFP
jgi:hypothetical protein